MMWKVGDLVRYRHPLGSLHLAIVIDVKNEYAEVYWVDTCPSSQKILYILLLGSYDITIP